MAVVLDLNADLGELPGGAGAALDEAMLAQVTSANVACGGHAGDDTSMSRLCDSAAALGVVVGAHVSYPDREGFGRRHRSYAGSELTRLLRGQLRALASAAAEAGTVVSYVKPHGALYNDAVDGDEHAAAVVAAVLAFGEPLAVLTLPDSALARLATAAGIPAYGEAFADRGYDPRGRLVPRGSPGAMITDPAEVVGRVVRLATTGTVRAVDGSSVPVDVRSVCVHGDTPGAVILATAVRDGLAAAGVGVAPFVSPVPE